MKNPPARHSVSVAAAIIDAQNRVLLTKRRDNAHWEPPGGVLELSETIDEGLRREVFEETGLRINLERLTGVYKNMTRGIVALVFRCSMASGSLAVNDEVADFHWATKTELYQYMTEAFRVRLVDALEGEQPSIRAHDGTRLV